MNRLRPLACALGALAALSGRASAQGSRDTLATVEIRVIRQDSQAVASVRVRVGAASAVTDASGLARLRLTPGPHRAVAQRLGYAPDSVSFSVSAARDTALIIVLTELSADLEAMVVRATRSERRIEDDPVRVEALDLEEVEEKVLMTPGDITMMMNETGGLRVQVTSPSLGGATVRVQGLRGRYTQVLSDGLPLFGGQTGGLGLLQIPPMDLGGVEVIKGIASALYGGSALGGVVNLTSRRVEGPPRHELLLNGTTAGGSDLVLFSGGTLGAPPARTRALPSRNTWDYTLLTSTHQQERVDRDGDGWADIAGYSRTVVRPRLFWRAPRGHTGMLTLGGTTESRAGGTVPGAVAPDGSPNPERLGTTRLDGGGTLRTLVGPTGIFSVRGSLSSQRHQHTFGGVLERDRHNTGFVEAAFTVAQPARTWVAGAALQHESYVARDVDGFDYSFVTPGVFAQGTFDLGARAALTTSVRADRHPEYGSFASPRASLLVRLGGSWTLRTSAGGGYFAPTPFTEETEVFGLTPLRPLGALRAERAQGASMDLGGIIGPLELNATVFASRIQNPVATRDAFTAVPRAELVNLDGPTRTAGGELLARVSIEPVRVTATYTLVSSSELDPVTMQRRRAALTPRHQAGVVASWEREGAFRSGLEFYYNGRQPLYDDAFRSESKAYLYIGALAEKRFGEVRVFVNAENLLDVRQSDWDPLVRPTRGLGGRWTNDVWAPLDGRVANAGVRFVTR